MSEGSHISTPQRIVTTGILVVTILAINKFIVAPIVQKVSLRWVEKMENFETESTK
jgi:hypothetical protein